MCADFSQKLYRNNVTSPHTTSASAARSIHCGSQSGREAKTINHNALHTIRFGEQETETNSRLAALYGKRRFTTFVITLSGVC